MKRVTWIRYLLAIAAVMAGVDMVALGLKTLAFNQSLATVDASMQLEQNLQAFQTETLALRDPSGQALDTQTVDLGQLDQELRSVFQDESTAQNESSSTKNPIIQLWSPLYTTLQTITPGDRTAIASVQADLDTLIAAIEVQRTELISDLARGQSNLQYMVIALAGLGLTAAVLAYVLLSRWLGELQQVVMVGHDRIDSIGGSIMQQRRVVSDQATSVAEITQMLDKLNGTSQTSSEQASIAASRAKDITELAGTGVKLVNQTQAAILGIETQTNAISEQILQLRVRAMEVGQIALLVEELAMRTNTLSLNAAIEAVRASRSGAGFQVIAKEIRELSVQSQQAARRIGSMSDDIERAVETTVSVTQEGLAQAEAGTRVVKDTTETFNQIQTAIEEVNDTSHRMAFNAYELLWPLQQLTEAMESLNSNAQSTETHSNLLADGLGDLESSFERIQDGIDDHLTKRFHRDQSAS